MIYHSTITLKSCPIRVIEKPGDGPAIFFIHGNSMSSQIWAEQLKDGIFDNFRLIAIDLPGHGKSAKSDKPHRDYNLPGYGKLLLKVLDNLKLDDYIIVGFSLGGNIALEVLAKLKVCRGIFLSGTVLFESAKHIPSALMPHPAVSYIFKADTTREQAAEAVELFFNLGTTTDRKLYIDNFTNTDPNCRSFLAKSIEEGKLSNNIEKIQKATIPIAYTTGAKDQYLDLAYLNSHSSFFWEGIKFLENSGHVPQTENPSQFNEYLLKFIQFCYAESVS
ncbi:alpha/beta fold hydrolase [Leeuwenhoekiella sp. A16]|uniref:alpha/beta fold hydrolase n=1 Tax=Leeuwenhoekiella sp. A16 TaxID=3141462 RepID=UPI003A8031AA